MRIEIESIDRNDIVLPGTDGTRGYRGRFRCPLVCGEAVFVPYDDKDERLAEGNSIPVETGQDSVSDFRIVSSDTAPRIEALAARGDYAVVGTTGLNTGDQVFEIDVGELSFTVDVAETAGIVPQVGQQVSFTIHGLYLWDEGY